jgi:hypothetical protein
MMHLSNGSFNNKCKAGQFYYVRAIPATASLDRIVQDPPFCRADHAAVSAFDGTLCSSGIDATAEVWKIPS